MQFKKTYNVILENGESEKEALDYARGMVWCEIHSCDEVVSHFNHIETINGVGVYYNYAADYYFFTDESVEAE